MQWLFLILAVLGGVLPFSYVFPFLMTHGLDVRLLISELFQNNVSGSFGLDVIISALVLFVFVFVEGRRLGMRYLWVYVVSTLFAGVSFGFPLFLFFRERKLNIDSRV